MKYPDENTLPGSKGDVLDRAGIQSGGYLNKKGTPSGFSASSSGVTGHIFNQLPPGTDIEDQSVADVKMPSKVKEVVEMSYPGDGWT